MSQPSLFDVLPRRLTVKALTNYIRQRLDNDPSLQNVWLEGEISNWKQAASGHIYFTLKDSAATIRCVIWRSQAYRLSYQPTSEGEAILAHGRVSVYEAGGNYQFYVDELQPLGLGDLHAEFARIKAALAAEGLFEADLKQPLPPFPRRIGLVTSREAAALQDILNVLRRRYPLAELILSPTLVQGQQAPRQIITALTALLDHSVEVIILARGGGSLEDLWAFNDEAVARTIAACPIPVVTGIGHETDYTIADFVADVRAPTPSAAAELVAPDSAELKRQLAAYRLTLTEATQRWLHQHRADLKQQNWALQRLSPQNVINNHRQRLDDRLIQMNRAAQHHLTRKRHQIDHLRAQLESLNPAAVLARGYAIVQKGSQIISQADQLQPGDEIVIKFDEGHVPAIVKEEIDF